MRPTTLTRDVRIFTLWQRGTIRKAIAYQMRLDYDVVRKAIVRVERRRWPRSNPDRRVDMVHQEVA